MQTMDKTDRQLFRMFVKASTDTQVLNILSDETERAEREEAKGDGSDYYATCKEIAREEAARRDL